jgi:alanine racemase
VLRYGRVGGCDLSLVGANPVSAHGCGAILTVDLDAIAANYRLLRDRLNGTDCAAVVKADAYALGADRVAPVLFAEGCRHFFVALLDEGVALRSHLPEASIYVLNGPTPNTEPIYAEHDLVPVLNHLGQVERWRHYCVGHGSRSAAIHVDTGMNRLGLGADEVARLAADPMALQGIHLAYIVSHLVTSEQADHQLNATQLARFIEMRRSLPKAPASLANSSGIFLGPAYQFDLARPGIAIFGGNPTPGQPNPMRGVVRLDGRIVQVRDVDSPMTVGYGATHRVPRKGKLATISVGYADGYTRALSGRGSCLIGEYRVPVVGRVSMDLISVDVTDVPTHLVEEGGLVELLGPTHSVDDLAREAGTISYEILTSLGPRYHRRYVGGTR